MKKFTQLYISFTKPTGMSYGMEKYSHLHVRVGRLNPDSWEDLPNRMEIGGLMLNSQISTTVPDIYAIEPVFDSLHTPTLRDLKRHMRTLSLIDTRLRKLTDRFGYVTTWADNVLRFADAVRAGRITVLTDVPGKSTFSYQDGRSVEDSYHDLQRIEMETIKLYGRLKEEEVA